MPETGGGEALEATGENENVGKASRKKSLSFSFDRVGYCKMYGC
jgi:hypothetical protein